MTIDFQIHDVLMALAGGATLGLASALLLLFNGRIAGISGITHRIFQLNLHDKAWRIAFLSGLILTGFILSQTFPQFFSFESATPQLKIILAGILVGFGATHGHGCTSGHGVCGISRFSLESILATLTFMGAGMLTVLAMKWIGDLP